MPWPAIPAPRTEGTTALTGTCNSTFFCTPLASLTFDGLGLDGDYGAGDQQGGQALDKHHGVSLSFKTMRKIPRAPCTWTDALQDNTCGKRETPGRISKMPHLLRIACCFTTRSRLTAMKMPVAAIRKPPRLRKISEASRAALARSHEGRSQLCRRLKSQRPTR